MNDDQPSIESLCIVVIVIAALASFVAVVIALF